jgi:hypothetical protein
MTTSWIKSVTFDTPDALVAGAFWAAALGGELDTDSTAEKAYVEAPGWGGVNLWFQRVPEGKTAKNRMHFDLRAPGTVAGEVARLEALGATVVTPGEELTVMADPDGNEFCVER